MNSTLALLSLAWLANLADQVLAGDSNYVRIDKKLRQNLNSEAVAENMKLARDYLATVRETNSRFQLSLIDSLEKFLALERTIQAGTACTQESFRILSQNSDATNGRSHRPGQDTPWLLHRVDSIVRQFFSRHAQLCHHRHPELLNERLARLAKSHLYSVELFMQHLVELKAQNNPPEVSSNQLNEEEMRAGKAVYNVLLHTIEYTGGEIHARAARDVIMKLAGPDHLAEALDVVAGAKMPNFLRTNNIKSLVKRYLIEPCQYYINQLGPVLDMIRFDRVSLGLDDTDSSTHNQRQPKESELQIESALGHYKVCKLFIERDRYSLTRNLIRWLSKASTRNI